MSCGKPVGLLPTSRPCPKLPQDEASPWAAAFEHALEADENCKLRRACKQASKLLLTSSLATTPRSSPRPLPSSSDASAHGLSCLYGRLRRDHRGLSGQGSSAHTFACAMASGKHTVIPPKSQPVWRQENPERSQTPKPAAVRVLNHAKLCQNQGKAGDKACMEVTLWRTCRLQESLSPGLPSG